MMQKVVDGKLYDTESATELGEYWNNYPLDDFNYCLEKLYLTKKGAYFLYGDGGAMSKYGTVVGNMRCGGNDIIPMSHEEAFQWAQENLEAEEVTALFADMVEEA
jgi:hypothetical protein